MHQTRWRASSRQTGSCFLVMAHQSRATSVPVVQHSTTAQSSTPITSSDVTHSQFMTKGVFSTSMLQVFHLPHRHPLQPREGREQSPLPILPRYRPPHQVSLPIPRSTEWLHGETTQPFSRLELFRVLHLTRRLAPPSRPTFSTRLAISELWELRSQVAEPIKHF